MILDIKKHTEYLDHYISLRNTYSEALLTKEITRDKTLAWIKEKDIEIFGFVEKKELLGIVILHVYRNGEITIFVKQKGRGIATELLRYIEKISLKRKLLSVWAWTKSDNYSAIHLFLKNNFAPKEIVHRVYNDKQIHGIEFLKYF